MKPVLFSICFGIATLADAAPQGWIAETPLEFIAVGRFQSPSDNEDLLIVDKESGLARLGLKNGNAIIWVEQPLGMKGITGLTTLRGAGMDGIAACSAEWNAIQYVSAPGAEPVMLSPQSRGPRLMTRLSTGHLAGAIVEDILTFTDVGGLDDASATYATATDGTHLFSQYANGLRTDSQFIGISTGNGLPMLVSNRGNRLWVEGVSRSGFEEAGFSSNDAHEAGMLWTASPGDLYVMGKDSMILEQMHLYSFPITPTYTTSPAIEALVNHSLPDTVETLETVPYVDPAYPDLNSLVAVRFTSAPGEVALYRVIHGPVPSCTLMKTLYVPSGDSPSALVTLGDDFMLLSGPGGRARRWKRYAQPAPGALPEVVASGSLPAMPRRTANPNVFLFNQDPFLTENAVLTSSLTRLDWTAFTSTTALGEEDGGSASGLGSVQAITVSAGGNVPLGNQLLPSASVASFGARDARVRTTVTFSPPAGSYAALDAGETFPVNLLGPAGTQVFYRGAGAPDWTLYDPEFPLELTASASVVAYAILPGTGEKSLLATASYAFAALPPATPSSAVDADQNGLSDAWERAFSISDPNSDTDGDGYNALTEQNYGTDPLDAGSRPGSTPDPEARLAAVSAGAGAITIDWPEGLVGYILESSPDLLTWTPVNPQPMVSAWSEPIGGPRKFYRLRKL